MHNLSGAYYLEELRDRDACMAVARKHYGGAGCRAAGESGRSRVNLWDAPDVVHYSLFEEAIGCSTGPIVLSRFFLERTAPLFAGPIAKIPLAYDAIARAPAGWSRISASSPS